MVKIDLVERVKDKKEKPEERGNALIMLAVDERKADLLGIIEEVKRGSEHELGDALVKAFPEPHIRSALANALGIAGGREVYETLMSLVQDPEERVRCDAILNAGEVKDSRVSFPLMNLYPLAGYEEQQFILLALRSLADPRTTSFLSKAYGDTALTDLADDAWKASADNFNFVYTFHGDEERREKAERAIGQFVLNSYDDIPEDIFLNTSCRQPQTYVVTRGVKFVIGGFLEEHVDVAQGKEVRAAGEAWFERQGDRWAITSINNRSNGYYPAANSYCWVSKALSKTGIQFPPGFTKVFPGEKGYGYCDKEFLQDQPFFKDA